MISLHNHAGRPLFIARAVYFANPAHRIRLYQEAWRSQKYPTGYELKFGRQWLDLDVLVPSNGQVDTYVPLETLPASESVPVGQRGTLLFEYVSEGKPGIHRSKL
jgi:hypothetical protein